MSFPHWKWWFTTDAGLLARIGIGTAIFAALAIADLMRNGRAARRWREYSFLLAVIAAAMAYGIVNDSIAVRISPEYFIYGKGVDPTGPVWREACMIGMKASFSAGLIIGVAMLLANNPRKDRPQLPYRRMFAWLAMVLACAVAGAGIGAAAGWLGGWNWISAELSAIWHEGLFRPARFMAVFGMNLGGYVGAGLGMVGAVAGIVRQRKAAWYRT